MRVRGPRGDDDYYEDLPYLAVNHAFGQDADLDLFDDEEIEAIRKERRDALARKKPCGFTAKWSDDAAL